MAMMRKTVVGEVVNFIKVFRGLCCQEPASNIVTLDEVNRCTTGRRFWDGVTTCGTQPVRLDILDDYEVLESVAQICLYDSTSVC